ncbi:GDSL-type esterase/lipase family protein [Verrucomicrobiota bacterium sgz303538]
MPSPSRSPILPRLTAASTLLLSLVAPVMLFAEPALQLKDNDVWVFAGDSITAQRLHTNYIEAYYRTHNPKLKLHFRNSGIGGNRTGNVLQRFDYDVAAWKPTIVSVELGMNDVNGPQEAYIKGMKEIIAKIRAIPAQPVLISSSPVNDGSVMEDWKSPRCQNIHPFTEALKKLAEEENVVVVDQYHPLLNVWGENRRKGEAEARAKGTWPPPETPASAPTAAGVATKPKPAPLPPSLINLEGDAVHPGATGQYTMAATILTELKADGDVSSAQLSADGKVVEAKHCKITEVSAQDGKLSFTRLDEASPWPIQPSAKAAFTLIPDGLKLSQYMLRVTGLSDGQYRVSINGKPAATLSAKELSNGWNATTAFDSALGERAKNILGLISKLQGPLNNAWREASKAKDAEKLAAAQKSIDECEAEIQTAIQPVAMRFEIAK